MCHSVSCQQVIQVMYIEYQDANFEDSATLICNKYIILLIGFLTYYILCLQ